jgi:hypothetical protein
MANQYIAGRHIATLCIGSQDKNRIKFEICSTVRATSLPVRNPPGLTSALPAEAPGPVGEPAKAALRLLPRDAKMGHALKLWKLIKQSRCIPKR